MQRKFEELRRNLIDFVEQREHLTLVLDAAGEYDVGYVLKFLEAIEAESAQDVYLTFAHACHDPRRYIDEAMAQCAEELAAGNRLVTEGGGEEGASVWPPLPEACMDSRSSTLARLRALVEYIRARLPDPVNRIVLAFLPTEVGNPDAYFEAVRPLIPADGYEAWMAGVRVYLLDRRGDDARLVPWIHEQLPFGAAVYPLDFTTPALTSALVEDAADPSVPKEDRMVALVQLAAIDHAYGRFPESFRKYGAAHSYFAETNNKAMQGVCLLGCAYLFERMDRLDDAKEKYRQALELGISSAEFQIVSNALFGLGALHQRLSDFPEAHTYWETAVIVSQRVGNTYAQCDALEQLGTCKIALDRTEEALEIWLGAKALAEHLVYWQRAAAVLEHVVYIERKEGRVGALAQHERELERARANMQEQQNGADTHAHGGPA